MRTTTFYLLLFALLITSCTGKQRGGSGDGNNKQAAELTLDSIKLQEVNKLEVVEEPQPLNYNDFPIAYVKNRALHFFNPETDTIVPFSEETDTVFNCVYSDKDAMFYYTVSRNGKLSIKQVNLSDKTAKPKLLIDLNLDAEKFLTETYGEKAKLEFIKDNLLLDCDFSWESYSFTKFHNYSIKDNTVAKIDWEQFASRYGSDFYSSEKSFDDYKSVYNKAKQLDLKKEDYADEDFEIEYIFGSTSADDSKIVFLILLGFGDLPHGPYCVANTDGTNMQLLEGTDIGSSIKPLWANNNAVFLRSYNTEAGEGGSEDGEWITELCYTRADDNAIVPIDRDVDYYAVRKIQPMQ